ncbi:MAG: MBL fold metallo-hydrolase [Thermoanaerobaculia bacterium]
MEIRSITAPNPGPYTLDGTRTYLLGASVVVDPGPAIDSHVEAIRAAQPGLNTIFITHRHADHAPAGLALQRLTGARIIAPPGVLDGHRNLDVVGGETLPLESGSLAVLATPGHTAEHVCYLTSDGDLFTGDTILGFGTTTIFPPDGNMADYLRSLHRLRALAPKRILPGHGPIREDAIDLIDHYIAHRQEREQQILAALTGGPRPVASLRNTIYPDLDRRLHDAAEIQLLAHLIKLESEGKSVRERDVWSLKK